MMGGYGPGYGYGYGNMMGASWFGGLLMLLFGALLIAGIVLLVMLVVRASGAHTAAGGPNAARGAAGHDEAVAIAKRRFASGEITKDQFDEIMRTLGG
jgi:putative membrane protein